jgi:crotonobetainyl-CoA:carnitine CoA-transferase CaiB-like acyl-CoA transferase
LDRSLENVRILDFTRLLPGPFGTQVLADLGADVVKIEDGGGGDYMRALPPLVKSMGAFFCALNRNKRSIVLDLKSPDAKKILEQFITNGRFDVVVEGFRPGVAKRLGIDYESLREFCPALIHASVPGFGEGSPKRTDAAHDANLLALSGILSVTGNQKTGPAMLGIQVDDKVTGLYLAIGILAAVNHRTQTGQGQQVEVPLADVALALNGLNLAEASAVGKSPGFAHHPLTGRVISYNVYRTKDDRWLSLGSVENKFWVNVCNTIGLPELIDEQFSEAIDGEQAFEKLRACFATKTLAQWLTEFDGVDACVEPVLECLEALEHPHYLAREMVETVDHPTEGRMRRVTLPVRMSKTPYALRHEPPTQGQQTDELLAEAGFLPDDIARFRKNGVIG